MSLHEKTMAEVAKLNIARLTGSLISLKLTPEEK